MSTQAAAAAQGTTEAAATTTTTPAAAGSTQQGSQSSAAPAAGSSQPAAAATQPGASAGDPKAGDAGKTQADPKAGQSQAKTDASQAQQSTVPAKYELKLPEKSPLDAAHVEKVSAAAKAQGLSNDEAQALLERDNEVATSAIEAQKQAYAKTTEGWLKASEADPEIGKALPENAEFAKRVVSKFGTPELSKFLDESKLGNHPETVRLLSRIHREFMAEDKMVITKQPAPRTFQDSDQAAASKLYGGKPVEGGPQQ